MRKFLFPALAAAVLFSTNAFAHDWDEDHHWKHRHEPRAKHVVVHHVYEAPEPPPVVYRERIVYRDRPVYYEREPQYEPPAPPPSYGGNRIMGQAIGAVAGAAVGSQLGRGNGRIAATAIGAVVGSVIGGHAAAGY